MKSIQFFSYNIRYKHFKMDCLHKEVKTLTTNMNKMLFCETLFKNLCLHFFGFVCCVACAT
jgi:hypothetical protein